MAASSAGRAAADDATDVAADAAAGSVATALAFGFRARKGARDDAPSGTQVTATKSGSHSAAPAFSADFFSLAMEVTCVIGAGWETPGVGGVIWLSAMIMFDLIKS